MAGTALSLSFGRREAPIRGRLPVPQAQPEQFLKHQQQTKSLEQVHVASRELEF
jgi:hypothetical protein